MNRIYTLLLLIFLSAAAPASSGLCAPGDLQSAQGGQTAFIARPAPVSLSDSIAGYARAQTSAPEKDGREAESSLFESVPLGWNLDTIRSFYDWALALPRKAPGFIGNFIKQGGMFGAVGSILVALFVAGVLYSVIWQKRVVRKIEKELQPLWDRVPAASHPVFFSFIRIIVAPFLPLFLLGVSLLIKGFIHYEVPWLALIAKLLGLWAAGVLVLKFLRETLTGGLLPFCPLYGRRIFRALRLAVVYTMAGMALVWGAGAIGLPVDVRAFIRFAVSLTLVCILSLLFPKKETLLSLLPRLPNRSYQVFTGFVNRAYFPLTLLTILTGVLWCLGYRRLSEEVLIKTWGVGAAYVVIMLSYRFLFKRLLQWSEIKEHLRDEAAQSFFRSARAFLQYGTVAIGALIILHLLGLLGPLHDVLSNPVYAIGQTPLSLWVFFEAGFILLAFVYLSHLLQAYLDYKIYPSIGVDAGLAYALNSLLRYLLFAVGFLSALRVIGLDLRVLMVFAGGVGIGAGIGLQHIAANVISGFIIVFGRKLRKGDWIKVGDKLGMVTHIYLRATRMWTRDNIEYIVPNTDLVSKTIVNYTLTSPIVRIYVPVGVSYDVEPSEVSKILLKCAEKHQAATQFRRPEVRIAGFGESSLDFELLVWIDISKIAEKDIKSRLYFTIIEALNEAGIEIPNPQRDIHIRNLSLPRAVSCTECQKDSVSRQANS